MCAGKGDGDRDLECAYRRRLSEKILGWRGGAGCCTVCF